MATEQALRQAQKMEAVGQLTGGIAHDFNNLLASISASLQVLRVRLAKGNSDGAERYISMSLDSVRRAGALTQRLLAFARRQTLDPKPTDVNRLVAGMEDLLRRSAGPNVAVEVISADKLWPTRIDPSQLENSLLNLCINARDAMLPDGGRLRIETANRWLDEHAAAELELARGQYVSVSVSDTGSGMSADVVKRVFDPFFTTKPLGQGTGLGLSMVYGFVRQSGGQIRIQSELGQGTTMCLYLPRYVGEVEADENAGAAEPVQAGDGQTVLIIEDETSIRSLMSEVLEEAGYRTLAAEDGQSGLRILQSGRRVDFLITDVGLPGGMNGRQVADAARVARPQLKVLFVTGYAENAAVGDGQLEHGMAIITKPFEITTLAKKVREMTEQL
jgi:nitrogen-specific signal transduction histidine kinase